MVIQECQSMSGAKPIVLWIVAGIGLILLYAAFKNKSPADIIKGTFGGGANTPPPSAGTTPS